MKGIEYADAYSHRVWEVLMSRFKKDESYKIGANDVSYIVHNAILDALNGMRPPHFSEDNKAEVSEDVGQTEPSIYVKIEEAALESIKHPYTCMPMKK